MYGCLQDAAGLMRAATSYLRDVARKRLMQDASPSGKGAAMLCVTASNGSYPTTAQAVYVVTPQEADCTDVEGATATYSGDTSQNFFAVNVGSQVPPQGTEVLVYAVGGRWVMRYDG